MEIDLPIIDEKKIEEIKKKNLESLIYHDDDLRRFINENNYSREFVINNLDIFLHYFNDREICKLCPGLINCKKNGFCYTIDNSVKFELRVCSCDLKKEHDKIKQKFVFYHSDDKYIDLFLTNLLEIHSKEREKLIENLKRKVKYIMKNEPITPIFLYGKDGIGKSCIMSVFAVSIIRYCPKARVAYVNTKDIVDSIVDSYYNNPASYEEDINLLSNIPYLFLDEFGQNTLSNIAKEEVLFKIIDNRNRNDLPTFYISNLPIKKIRSKYYINDSDSRTMKCLDYIASNKIRKYELICVKI
ncbi:MAG: ATP-binding protein [Bacillales bacterium]|nr:ATP-binding protein [Bacillales bacterium]